MCSVWTLLVTWMFLVTLVILYTSWNWSGCVEAKAWLNVPWYWSAFVFGDIGSWELATDGRLFSVLNTVNPSYLGQILKFVYSIYVVPKQTSVKVKAKQMQTCQDLFLKVKEKWNKTHYSNILKAFWRIPQCSQMLKIISQLYNSEKDVKRPRKGWIFQRLKRVRHISFISSIENPNK